MTGPMVATIFPNKEAKVASPVELGALLKSLRDPPEQPSKDACELFLMARIGTKRTMKDSLRSNANVLELSAVTGDYDGEQVSIEEARDRLEVLGVKAILYTSPSHTSDRPRWRVVAPLSRALPPSAFPGLAARLNAALAGILAPESKTLSQSYYFGRVNGREYECVESAGREIDLLLDLDDLIPEAGAEPRPFTRSADTDDELRAHIVNGDKGEIYLALLKLCARLVGRGMESPEVIATLQGLLEQSALQEIDPRTWQRRIEGLPQMAESAARKYGDRRTRDVRSGPQGDANDTRHTDTASDASDAPEGDSDASGHGSPEAPAPIDILKAAAAPPLRISDVPPALAHFADSQARATGFDVSILLAAGVGAACAALSDEVRLCISPRSNWYESARLWIAVVGGPGSGKSPGIKAAMAPVFAIHREVLADWGKKHKDDEEKPPAPAVYVSDATTEALADTLQGTDRGLLYFTDEVEAWLASHDAYRNGAGKDRGEWLRLYDGGPHQVNRVKRGSFFVQNWGVSLLSATTPSALRKLAPKLPDDGLLQRLLLVLARPRTMADAAMLRVETRRPLDEWDATLRRIFSRGPSVVRLSIEARASFEAEQLELHELTQAFEDINPSLAAHVAKRAAMLARLALVFHAIEAPANELEMSGATMDMAVRFLRRQEKHTQAIYGSMLGADTGMALAKDAARSILGSRLERFNRRELTHKCKAFRLADEQTRQAALTFLRDCGWIALGSQTLGHGAHWAVDPRVHSLFADHGTAARRRRELVRARLVDGEDDQ